MSETITTDHAAQLPILSIPAFKIIPTIKTTLINKGIWFNPQTAYPCCSAGVLYSETQADVVAMKDDGFVFPASEHRISPPMQKDESIFEPCVSFQFSAKGNPVVNASRFLEEDTPAQLVSTTIATLQQILQETIITRPQVETNTCIDYQYKLMCTDEEKLTALSRLQLIKQTMQQNSLDVITPEEAGQRLEKHLNLRFDAQQKVREEYMKMKNLTCSKPPSNFKFAFSRCADVLGQIDTVQRHTMQESSVETSACAERCAIAFIEASAPLAVNWTVQSGLALTAANTASQVFDNFKQDNVLCVQQVLKKITDKSVTTELARYQADSSLEVVQENNNFFCECASTAGECQQYNNMFKSQVVCNQLMRAQKARPVSLFSAACAADDCEGGACSAVNVMLYLKCNSEETIKRDILQACQCIDLFTGNLDPTTFYETHKRAFEMMALNVKQYLQADTVNVGVASLLASAAKMTQNNKQVSNEGCTNVQNFESYWQTKMSDGGLGGHAVGLVHDVEKQLEVKIGSAEETDTSKQPKYVINSSGTTPIFLKGCYVAEGTAPSKQLPLKDSQKQTTLSFGTGEVFRSCNAQTQNAIEMLRQKYDKQSTPLVEALNVTELLTTALSFSNISENPTVMPTNYFALGDGTGKFYDTLLLSGNLLYCSVDFENGKMAEGVDMTGRLVNSNVVSFETCVGKDERRLCRLLDMTNHNHLLKAGQIFEVRKQAGMVPSALPSLVRTKYNECAVEKASSLRTKLPMTLPQRNAQVTCNDDSFQLRINMRFPEYTQARDLEERNRLIMARKLEIRKLSDKEIYFQQGAYNNLMQLFISV